MNTAPQEPAPPFPPQYQEKPGLESKMHRPLFEAPSYRGSGELGGQVALITGGDSGIGRAVGVLFARERADVAIVSLAEKQSDAAETRQAVEVEGRRALLIPGDVRDSEFCRDAVGRTIQKFRLFASSVDSSCVTGEVLTLLGRETTTA
jgi:NAD(P)-dependent dehydrogenase (short-subunit alcohol dehydrogenase family)